MKEVAGLDADLVGKVSGLFFTEDPEGFEAVNVGDAEYALTGEYLTVKIRKSLLGAGGEIKDLIFKWADNSTVSGNVMEFMDLGDTAPNDRYAFRYVGYEGETAQSGTEDILTEKAELTDKTETSPAGEKPADNSEEKSFPIIEVTAVAVAVIAVAAAVIIKTKKK